jgi:hypothetical protein
MCRLARSTPCGVDEHQTCIYRAMTLRDLVAKVGPEGEDGKPPRRGPLSHRIVEHVPSAGRHHSPRIIHDAIAGQCAGTSGMLTPPKRLLGETPFGRREW